MFIALHDLFSHNQTKFEQFKMSFSLFAHIIMGELSPISGFFNRYLNAFLFSTVI